LIRTDTSVAIEQLTLDSLRRSLRDCARWVRGPRQQEVLPPLDLVRTMLAHESAPLPLLRRVVDYPVYTAGGDFLFCEGYDADTDIYLARDFTAVRNLGLEFSRLPASHRLEELMKCFEDFPIENLSSKAHLLALLCTPLLRELIDGPTPLFCINKPAPGLGGTLLAQVVATIITGNPAPIIPPPDRRDGAEVRRLLTSYLRDQPALIVLDNWDDLQSPGLAALLTSTHFADRQIGFSNIFTGENRSLVLAVCNNVTLSPEIARRTVPIHLGLVGPDPLTRDFRIPDLLGWTRRHRQRLLAALIGMTEAWRAAGRPKSRRRLPSFERWSAIIGGVLEANGVAGFLDNVDRGAARSQPTWGKFCELWSRKFADQPVSAAELLELAVEAGVCEPEVSALSLGRMLSARAGSLMGGFMIKRLGRSDNTGLYSLVLCSATTARRARTDQTSLGTAKFMQ
jgi:hypothetical protein